jgi:hypothetical protein
MVQELIPRVLHRVDSSRGEDGMRPISGNDSSDATVSNGCFHVCSCEGREVRRGVRERRRNSRVDSTTQAGPEARQGNGISPPPNPIDIPSPLYVVEPGAQLGVPLGLDL